MGKTNKANRTKGNTRPSSSGHSAELLGIGSLGGFVGFGGALGKDAAPSYVPVTGQQTDAPDTTVDADFRMVMRKMLKRDSITRLKAVQEFGDYCVEKDKEIVKNVLPFWPRLFNRLALDFDRRVREATHVAHGKLISKVKREVAPFLKGIMGAWLVGQCDSHAPASSAAQATFADTFPSSKQSEAVLFCKDEVFAYFKDNLFEQTVKSMSDPNTSTPEDMESKYNLVVSATLQATKLFLVIVQTSKQNDAVQEEILSVVDNAKFWKFAKNKESQIRGAWFSLVGSICQMMPAVFGGNVKKLSTTVFGCLSESDPVVAPAVWESALSVAVNVEDCWQGIDIQKVALHQLWLLLQGGGKGNSSTLFPCLLPFLSRLPIEIVEADSFLQQFFSSFVKGLMLESVKRSTTECDAILNAFFECLQFMCLSRLGKKGPPLMEDVLLNQVVPLLSSAIFNPEAVHLSVSRLCPLLASLLSKLEGSPSYSGAVGMFWGRALPLTFEVFGSRERWEVGLMFLAYFFNSLFEGEAPKEKKTVRFKNENQTIQEEPIPTVTIKKSQSILANKTSVSFKYVVDFCAKLCGEIEKDPSRSLGYTRLLEEILTSASSEELLEELAHRCLQDEKDDDSKSTPKFVEKIVLKWMCESKTENEKLDSLINITLLACSFMSLEESRKILDSCSTVDVCVAERLLRRGLSVCRRADFFRGWFGCCSRGALSCLKELLCTGNIFAEGVERKVTGSAKILEICLMDTDTELLIKDDTLKDLLVFLLNLCTQVFRPKLAEKIRVEDFILLRNITTALMKNPRRCCKFEAEQLIFLIFNEFLNQCHLFENYAETTETLYGVLEVAIDSYISAEREILAESSSTCEMAKELNSRMQTMRDNNSTMVQSHCLFLLSNVRKYLTPVDSSVAIFATRKLADTLLPSPEEWNGLKKGLKVNFLPLFLQKKLFYPLNFNDEKFFYDEDKVESLMLAVQVVSNILDSDVLAFKNDDEEVPERSHVVEHLPHLLWCVAFCQGTRKRVEMQSEIKMCFGKTYEQQLRSSWTQMLDLLRPNEIDELKQNIFNMALSNGEFAICLGILGELLPSGRLQSFAEEQFQSASPLCMSESKERYLLRQVLIPHLSLEKKRMHFEELLIELSETKTVDDKNFPGKMGEVCCYFQDGQLLASPQMQLETLLMPTFRTVAAHLQEEDKQLHSTLRLQIETIVFSATTGNLYLLNSDVWEFFLLELSKLLIDKNYLQLTTPCSLVFLHRILRLYSFLDILFVASKDDEDLLKWKPPGLPQICHETIFELFVDIAMKDEKTFPSESHGLVLDSLLESVYHLPPLVLVKMLTDSRLDRVVAALSSTVRQIQLGAHSLLNGAMPLLPDILRKPDDDSEEDQGKRDEFERIPKRLSPLLEKLLLLQEIVETLLGDLKIGDPCSVVPHTDSYCLTMAYLLAWAQVLEFISAAPSQIRLGYATDLTEKGLLPSLFPNVFRLTPDNPTVSLKRWASLETPKKEDMRALFLRAPRIDTDSPCSEEEIQIVACYVYAMALRKVPASVRSWFNNLDRKSADIVNNFTTKYVSSHLCAAEIQEVHEIGKKFENLTVQGRPGSREVVATYTVDEASIELCLQLPPNHPLSPILTERRGRVGVGEQEWRQWLLQLKTTLTYQNGSLLDGLSIWQRNLDKKFEGVEECMICYYVLHSTSLKLPRLSCHVCRKKFHSACLYKWFRTSNNSTCPLCRNEFHM